jgi:hypothetical protein
MLTDEQAQTLILSLADARGDKGFTEEEANSVCEWAVGVMTETALLEAILMGDMNIDIVDDEPVFGLTPSGHKKAEELIFSEGKLGPPDAIQ